MALLLLVFCLLWVPHNLLQMGYLVKKEVVR